jgi:hypothetical protein
MKTSDAAATKTSEASAAVKASEATAMEAAAKPAACRRILDLGNQREQPRDPQYENSAHLTLLLADCVA